MSNTKSQILTEILNREPPIKELVSSFITTKGAYNRNHSVIPQINGARHFITIDGEVDAPFAISVSQLRNEFPQHEVLKEVHGVDWADGAMMNCKWKGPRLRDILTRAQLKDKNPEESMLNVAFACFQAPCQDDDYYGVSIELWRAMQMDQEVILALEMNDKPLLPEYGFPVRVVVPGVAGARWVKWLDRITVQAEESPNFYQQHDYRVLPVEASTWEIAEKYWSTVPSIQAMPVNSVVAVPDDGDTVKLSSDGCLEVKGYAVPAGSQGPVVRVEVSTDGGKTWVDAEIQDNKPQSKWSWTLWKVQVKAERGEDMTIYSRATDGGGNTQPEFSQWNIRGVVYNGYGASWNVNIV
ncbi:sulfite oxidase [Arthroderma uncinatum]|uniref:sulfite oxidase n=1 Tax=Arthroderma uncinatum TaxID=74035 RepID=UPI00144AB299|nr:sulfite oxidase [Arthroderma uncinatum]KAF3479661.1 sulfite oxidase [Arthroderma uncinatum]